MDPKPVQVLLRDGTEGLGIAIAADAVDVGPMGMFVQLFDLIKIDDEPRQVTARKIQMDSPHKMGWPETEGWNCMVQLKHRSVG